MTSATVTSKGQITIPVEVRRKLGVQAGHRILFVEVVPGRFEIMAATQPITALKGMLGKPKRSLTIDEMNAVIARRGAGLK